MRRAEMSFDSNFRPPHFALCSGREFVYKGGLNLAFVKTIKIVVATFLVERI